MNQNEYKVEIDNPPLNSVGKSSSNACSSVAHRNLESPFCSNNTRFQSSDNSSNRSSVRFLKDIQNAGSLIAMKFTNRKCSEIKDIKLFKNLVILNRSNLISQATF